MSDRVKLIMKLIKQPEEISRTDNNDRENDSTTTTTPLDVVTNRAPTTDEIIDECYRENKTVSDIDTTSREVSNPYSSNIHEEFVMGEK